MDNLSEDFTRLDDSALLGMRADMRAELERLPPGSPGYAALTALYDKTTGEVDDRARRAWTRAGQAPAVNEPVTVQAAASHLPPRAAAMAAVEILLADPAALGDDTLESALYILREKLRAAR